MSCYLCESKKFRKRKGRVRDNYNLEIIECIDCGLVQLGSASHISPEFYENSGMHGPELRSIEAWLKETEWDDQRRFDMMKAMLPNKRLLDFGCGAGGFLMRAKSLAAEVTGIELESRVRKHWEGEINIVLNPEAAGKGYDFITAFHVVEHLSNPRVMLTNLSKMLRPGGRMIVEVPSSEDALLTLYDCDAFQHFTYWSQHLFLFNGKTLEILARQAGLRVVALQHYQRYPLSNHLHWLSQGKPGGHELWAFLDTPELASAYTATLAALGKTDTLIAYLEHGA